MNSDIVSNKLNDLFDKDEEAYKFEKEDEAYNILSVLIDASLAFFLVYIIVLPALKWIEPEGVDPVLLAQLTLAVVTTFMALAIYRQVTKESKYLENFEPSIAVVSDFKTKLIKNEKRLVSHFQIVNDSQTAAYISKVVVENFNINANNTESRRNLSEKLEKKIVIPPNQSKEFKLYFYSPTESSLAYLNLGEAMKEIEDEKEIKLRFEGNFSESINYTLQIKDSDISHH